MADQTVGEVRSVMRDFVTAKDETKYDYQAQGCIRLDVTHSNLVQKWHALNFFRDGTLFEVKEKLYRHGGTGVASAELYLKRGYDTIFMYDDNKTLRDYGAENDMEIHIKDCDIYSLSRNGGLEDVSLVEKYNMTDDDYDKRENTVRQIRKNGSWTTNVKPTERPSTPTNARELYPIGARCEVNPGGRRGEVAYLGKVDSLSGTWIGARLDEPQGQNEGKGKNGQIYFECMPNYGVFARCENVEIGDFPALDPFAFLDEGDEI